MGFVVLYLRHRGLSNVQSFFEKKKGRGAGKTTNLPPAIIHMKTRENTYPQTHIYHIRSILQGENGLARIGLLE